jgi:hypothetical protein
MGNRITICIVLPPEVHERLKEELFRRHLRGENQRRASKSRIIAEALEYRWSAIDNGNNTVLPADMEAERDADSG